MTDVYDVTFEAAAEREPFLAATEFDWDFDNWYSDIIVGSREHISSSWAGPVAALHWELAPIDPAFPGTASLEVQLLLGDPVDRAERTPISKASSAEHAAATVALNNVVPELFANAKAELSVFSDRSYRQWELRSSDEAGTSAYLNVVFDEPESLTDTERDALNAQLSDFSRRHLFTAVASLLRAGVFVRRGPIRGQFESSGVGPLTTALLPR